MADLIVYGSLMAKNELRLLGVDLTLATRVIVRGFRRTFAQEPSWRQGRGFERAVLTVVRSPQSSFNGILLLGMSQGLFDRLDMRERGYDRYPLSRQQVQSFDPNEAVSYEAPFLYVGKPERYNSQLRPNPAYRQTCLAAAQDWGHDFYQEFYNSTDNLT